MTTAEKGDGREAKQDEKQAKAEEKDKKEEEGEEQEQAEAEAEEEEEEAKEGKEPKGDLWSLAGIAMVGFLGPLEYSVVMPSLWFYLQQLGEPSQLFYGLVLSSFSFAHMLASPPVGWLADQSSLRTLLCAGMLVSAAGHVIYALAWSQMAVLLGRVVAGAGAANFTLVGVYVARTSTVASRTTLAARLNLFTETGLLLGPAFAALFDRIDVEWGPIVIDRYTAPGYLMFLACFLHFFYLLLFFRDPPKPGLKGKRKQPLLKGGKEEEEEQEGERERTKEKHVAFKQEEGIQEREVKLKYDEEDESGDIFHDSEEATRFRAPSFSSIASEEKHMIPRVAMNVINFLFFPLAILSLRI